MSMTMVMSCCFRSPPTFIICGLEAGQCVHCVVGRLGLFLYGFYFRFKGFFRCFIFLILRWFNHEEPALFAVMFAAPRGLDGSRGAVGLGMAGRGATLILRTSWFNCSSWIRAKEIVAIRVYSCRAFTSPRIFSFSPSIKELLEKVEVDEMATGAARSLL
ncbi:hypothetical protein B296_00027925 [Ensete ventricosum]|uniref:Uncharacterized protein n=1 Tax=Ensete ventricosum TaxID=4639 RepID=A0A426ZDR3_ENSVE|nr:hypothetical protein B296_00027925 [Ensete ventricosum]